MNADPSNASSIVGSPSITDANSQLELLKEITPPSICDWEYYRIQDICFSPDGKHIAYISRSQACEHTLRMIELETEKTIFQMYADEQHEFLTDISWSPDGSHIAVAYGKQVDLWHISNKTKRSTHIASAISGIQYSPEGQLLSVYSSHELYIWDLDSFMPRKINLNSSLIHDISWSADGMRLIIATDSSIMVWGVDRGILPCLLEAGASGIQCSGTDGLLAYISVEKNAIHILFPTGKSKEISRLPCGKFPQICFSHDGTLFAAKWVKHHDDQISEAAIWIWDCRTWNKIETVTFANEGEVKQPDESNGLCFHPCRNILLSSSPFSRTMQLWQL